MNGNPRARSGRDVVRSGHVALLAVAAFALSAGCVGVASPDVVETPTPSPTPVVPVADPTYAAIAPDLPTEESLTALGFAVAVLVEPEVVAGPGFATELRGVIVTDELTPEQRDALYLSTHVPEGWRFSEVRDEPLLAGPGREFLLAWLDIPGDAPSSGAGGVQLTVDVEGESRPVEDAIVPWGVVVLSVPVDAPANLHIHHAGQVRSIDLRTGENRSESAQATDGLHRGYEVVTDFFRVEGITTADMLEGAILRVRIEPVHGTAAHELEPDHMKLSADLTVMFNTGFDWNIADYAAVEVDLASSVTIVADNGEEIPVPDVTLTAATPGFYTAPTVEGSTSMTFDVPDTVRSFDVTFRLDATFTARDDDSNLPYERHDTPRNTGTLTMESAV